MAIVARDVLSGEFAIAEEDIWTRAGTFAASGVLGALWFVFALSRRGRVLFNVLIGTLLVLSAAFGSPLDPGEQTEVLAFAFVMWLLPVALALTAGLIFRRSGTIERGPTGPLAGGPGPHASTEEPHVVSSPHAGPPENTHQRQGEEIEAADASRARPATADPHSNLRAFGADRPEDEDRQQEGVHVHPTPHGDRAGSAEVENERQATSGRPPLPRSSRFAVTRFRVLVLALLSVAVAGAFWTTRWQYLASPRGMMRVNRWTGAAQVYRCGLTQKGAQEIRVLQIQLANTMLAPDVLGVDIPPIDPAVPNARGFDRLGPAVPKGHGLRALLGPPLEVDEILPCPTCSVDGEKAEEIARRYRTEGRPPWGTERRVLDLLERLETTRATHWQCEYR